MEINWCIASVNVAAGAMEAKIKIHDKVAKDTLKSQLIFGKRLVTLQQHITKARDRFGLNSVKSFRQRVIDGPIKKYDNIPYRERILNDYKRFPAIYDEVNYQKEKTMKSII
eukprot:53509_1